MADTSIFPLMGDEKSETLETIARIIETSCDVSPIAAHRMAEEILAATTARKADERPREHCEIP